MRAVELPFRKQPWDEFCTFPGTKRYFGMLRAGLWVSEHSTVGLRKLDLADRGTNLIFLIWSYLVQEWSAD